MRKFLSLIVVGMIIPAVSACNYQKKDKTIMTDNKKIKTDDIVKSIYVDDEFGDEKMEVIIDNTKNVVTIHLDGKTYQLNKSIDLPNYTAESTEYKFSDIKGEIIFLKKDADMVLFHHEPNSNLQNKESSGMTSY